MQRPIASDFKRGRESFTRDGALSPELLISLLVYMASDGGRRGYQQVLDAFWDEAKSSGVALPTADPVSSASFCNARKRICAAAVRQVLLDASAEFDRVHGPAHRFQGRRVLAVDGSKMHLQRSPQLWAEFGGHSGGLVPQVLVTVLFDVIAKLPVDAVIAPYASDERAQLGRLLPSTREGDILVLDRGYPSYVVFDLLLEQRVDFVVRVPAEGGYLAVEEFTRSGRVDADVTLTPAPGTRAGKISSKTLRAVRSIGPEGQLRILLTSLPRSQFTRESICALYERRWQVELFYRLEKSDYVGHHQFHAKSPEGVRQEVFAFLLYTAITRTLMAAAARKHGVTYPRMSQKSALLATARVLTMILLECDPRCLRRVLPALLRRLAVRLEPIRPRRSCPRRSFKPRPRWEPKGQACAHVRREDVR